MITITTVQQLQFCQGELSDNRDIEMELDLRGATWGRNLALIKAEAPKWIRKAIRKGRFGRLFIETDGEDVVRMFLSKTKAALCKDEAVCILDRR